MFLKLPACTSLQDHVLLAVFTSGERRLLNCEALCQEHAVFRSLLSDPALFTRVRVDSGGYGISWSDALDLSAEYLWHHGDPV